MGHCPVLLSEVLEHLTHKINGEYLDCTFGAGGYTKAFLNINDNIKVTSLDQDPTVRKFAEEIKSEFKDRFEFVQANFADAKQLLGNKKFDAIILDLGISSMQVDTADRGFSFMYDGPLDMRMSNEGMSAHEWISKASEQEIADVIYKYGEEVQSRAIARSIVEHRLDNEIDTTLKLAEIVRNAMHYRHGKIDPATKTFQAIRIFINKELYALEKILSDLRDLLNDEGIVAIVSFHSLEDSIVKNFFKCNSAKKISKSKYAKDLDVFNENEWLKIITKKPITPTLTEVRQNIRSRSAKLRIAQKIGGRNVA
ncbi:MAG: 16S rRNA (cytosine(1402)-N(4))-methyltransferase RsmH [Rickettsiales bacterium]|nr:MAG: 16S rRNA (cytosine(1402)-N(4))-methyltransferase RsmH [Rickettsiales bacterium]